MKINTIDLYDYLELISIGIWERIAFAREFDLCISETTITENLVYALYQLKKIYAVPILIFLSKDEAANGNDIEIFIETKEGNLISFCIQSKIINKQNRYPAISHKVRGAFQIDILLKHAQEHGAIPMYMFYNYYPGEWVDISVTDEEDFETTEGATLFKAFEIKKNFFKRTVKTPTFHSLHSLPFECLPQFVCGNIDRSNQDLKKQFPLGYNIRFYDKKEVLGNPKWERKLKPIRLAGIGDPHLTIEERKSQRSIRKQIQKSTIKGDRFKPKYRLVFLQDIPKE